MTDETIARRPPDALFTPVSDVWTQPFWDAARKNRLVVPRCGHCGSFRMPPTPFCPSCRTQAIDWVELGGRGTIFSYSAVMRPVMAEMAEHVPYVVAVVELEGGGGTRLITNIVETALSRVRVGAAVRVVFDRRDDGIVVPRFAVAENVQ